MLDIQQIRRINTARIVDENFGGVNRRLADRLNELRNPDEGVIQASYITRILKPDASGARKIGNQTARRIEAAAGKPLNWLDQEHRKVASATLGDTGVVSDQLYAGLSSPPPTRGRVPIVSYVVAGQWAEIEDHFLPPDEYEYIEASESLDSTQAIALRVDNDSMFREGDPRSFPPGCIIVVKRPDLRNPVSGDFVVVRLEEENRATFKQLIHDGDRTYLRPLNPAYPTIHVDKPAHFVGVVTEKIIKMRY